MKWISAVLCLLLSACAGVHSTVKDGYAYEMTDGQASALVDSIIRSNVAGDRMLPGGKLVASGYDRVLTDTQTYTATAIPVVRQNAFGFELKHEGTMFKGPSKAKGMFRDLNARAALAGRRVSIVP